MQKQMVIEVVESMPDDVDLDQLLSKLYVLEKIKAGERALVERGGVPQADVEKRNQPQF
ncbi:MAG: hypothetical protein L0211_24450 [Planctomycetaceae bacterium]|nr:hypothetical protein [Planctomycetaceae bacterium]